MGSLPKPTKSSIYQASLDNRVYESIIKAMEKLQRETIEYWYYCLIDNEENGMVAMKETIEELKSREENENN